MRKLQIIMISTLLAFRSTKFIQTMEGPESDNSGKSGSKTTSSNKSTEQINQDRIKETQAQTTANNAKYKDLKQDAYTNAFTA